jgi:hypothetical protein
MPNWVSTTLSVKGSKEEVYRFIDGVTDSKILQSYVPCPEELQNTVAGSVPEDKAEEHRKQKESNIAKYGHKDWYDWAYDNWGSKWGDCDTDIQPVSEDSFGVFEVIVQYQTAWSCADTGFLKVSQMFPSLYFTFDYDEEAGFFSGLHVFHNGNIIFESMYEPCNYPHPIDWDDYDSIDKYDEWKVKNSDTIHAEYVLFMADKHYTNSNQEKEPF